MIRLDLNFPSYVTREEDFFGRRDDRAEMEHNYFDLAHPKPVMVEGQRRIGKTSLVHVALRAVQTKSGGRFVPIFLPKGDSLPSFQDYAYAILYALCRQVGRKTDDTGLLDASGKVRFRSAQELADGLAEIAALAGKDTEYILCVDELDACLVRCQENAVTNADRDADKIISLTDALIEGVSSTRLEFVFTSLMTPDELKTTYGSPFVGKCQVLKLQPMPRDDVYELVRGLLRDQVVLDAEAMSLLHGLGGGSPFFIKLFLQHLWQRWRLKEPPLPVGGDMIRELLQEACDDRQAKGVLENIYERHLYPPERALLILFADRQAEMQDVAESPEVRRQELDLLGSEYLSAARSLESRGYLEGETDAGYRLRFGYLGHWLRNWYRYDVERDRLQVARLSEKLQTEVRVNRERDEVFVKGHRAKLSPMEMKAIVCLASAAPSVVSRDQLADALWPEAQGGVTDNQIDQVIRRLRLALGETAEPWRYVKRMGGGYRVERTALVDS